MLPEYINEDQLHSFIEMAFSEDVGNGDHTTLASIPKQAQKKAQLLIKDKGILAGVYLAQRIFQYLKEDIKFITKKKDGQEVDDGDIGFIVQGNAREILTAERLVLNCMQRMSGIATYTHHLNQLIKGTNAKLLDTRKTTPNFRMMEKWAVLLGGGLNHRFGLFDMILIKDNHIDFAGSIDHAISSTLHYLEQNNKNLKIEVEIRKLIEIDEALNTGKVDRLLLDNMSVSQLSEAVMQIDGRVETEASGGITEQNIREIAKTGVDYISVGALTHSIKSLDMSLMAMD
jgi:nicotinate-nucleotide pyrophosphorylase (carboxylating)